MASRLGNRGIMARRRGAKKDGKWGSGEVGKGEKKARALARAFSFQLSAFS